MSAPNPNVEIPMSSTASENRLEEPAAPDTTADAGESMEDVRSSAPAPTAASEGDVQASTATATQEGDLEAPAGEDAGAGAGNGAGGADEADTQDGPAGAGSRDVQKPGYIDYLRSPIVSIIVGISPNETVLTCHLALLLKSPYLLTLCQEFTADTPFPDRTVSLPDEDLPAVGSFLEYLYTGEYTPRLVPSGAAGSYEIDGRKGDEVDENGDDLLQHARVYTLSEKLGMQDLKKLAHRKIHRINATARGELRYARFVYANTAREDVTIRNPIATFWAQRSHVLRHEAEDEFRRMILEFPQFSYDILTIMLDNKEKPRKEKDRERLTIEGSGKRSADTAGHDSEAGSMRPPPHTPASAERGGGRGSHRKRPRVSSGSTQQGTEISH